MREPVTRGVIFISLLLAGFDASAQSQKIGAPPEAQNMRLVGANDLQARSAYQPTIHRQGERWIAYIGHHGGTDETPAPVNPQTGKPEPNGTSIVDVTDPAAPRYLRHLPGQEGKYESGGAQMVRICDSKSLPKGDRNAVYMLRTFGGEAHEIWNVADPANPVLITRIGGLKDTHKNFWECDTGIAYGALPGRADVAIEQPAFREIPFREIAWPFPRDGWPAGRAFRCESGCSGIELYVRPKLGFCNCDRGVADDDEVDRVSDLDLISPRFAPLQPGEPVRVADMPGRLRAYELRMQDEARRVAVGIAAAHRCDVLVAVAQGSAAARDVQRFAAAVLETNEIRQWLQKAMQLR